ncbi:MAG: glycoside hydrolase family 3 protein [Treponema sp.]|nr:glycoside hydrolase family 3 protein [Treponema sp.]
MLSRKNKSFCLLLCIFLCTVLFACTKSNSAKIDQAADKRELALRANARDLFEYGKQTLENRKKAYTEYLESFSLEEKISQLFIANIDGQKNYAPMEFYDNGKPLIPGGYLFFGFNLAPTSLQIINFTQSVTDYCVKNNAAAPFLAIDHEGGPVNRLRTINAPLQSCEVIAKEYSVSQAYNIYDLQAKQLKYLGFHMNLAPVAELCTQDNADFLSGRSYGNEQQVTDYASACVTAHENNNVATVVKHFPGNTNTDPHLGLPVIKMTEAQIKENLKCFINVLQSNPSAVLMSHAIVDSVDPNTPSCLSKKWVTDILRNEYGYNGVIFSDDIFMAALAKNGFDTKTAVIMAIEAGIDCIMISGKNIKYPVSVLKEKAMEDASFKEKIQNSFERIVNYKIQSGILEYKALKDGTFTIQNKPATITAKDQNELFDAAKNENLKIYK